MVFKGVSLTLLLVLIASSSVRLSHATNQGGIDVSGSTACTIRTCHSATFSTTNNNDLILIAIYEGTSGTGVASISDTAGLLFQSPWGPQKVGGIFVLEQWISSTKDLLTNDQLNIALNGPVSMNWNFTFVAVSGSFFTSPYDPLSPVFGSGNTCTGWPTFTVLTYPEMIIGFGASTGSTTMTLDTGFTGISTLGPNIGSEYQIANSFQSSLQVSFNQKPCAGAASWGVVIDVICVNTLVGCGGGKQQQPNPTQGNFQSVSGPGGYPIPPQLADQNILGYVFLLSAAIALSSLELPQRQKRTPRELRLG